MHISTCNQVTKKPVQANCETRHSSNLMHSLHYSLTQRFIFIYYVNVVYLIKKSRKHLSMEFGEACMYPEILMDENVFNSENGTTDHTSNIFKLYDGKLHVEGFPFLSEVESTLISLTPFSSICNNIKYNNTGAFLGFHAPETASRHVIPLGKLQDIRFMSILRFKVWWSTLCVGSNGSDVEYETQFLLFDTATASSNGRHLLGPVPYVLFLPIIDGKFRASLQGSCRDTLDLCMESGSPAVQGTSFKTCVYIHAGENPYDLARDAVLALRTYLGTFTPSVEKLPPPIIDKFGWCTWDGFYMAVNPEGARRGVQEFADGGCSLGFLIIDDGWQSISDPQDPNTETTPIATCDRMTCRLRSFSENSKFKNYNSSTNTKIGMAAFVEELKWDFKTLKYVYVWHALCGYWGGVHPSSTKLKTRIHMPVLSEGLKKLMPDPAVDNQFINGVAVIHPNDAHELYDTYMHSHIAKMGIDGIKIDVLHELEMICSEYGGRVEMNKAYFKALTASVEKHFKGNQVISSMEQCNDFMLHGTKTISCGRVGDNFWTVDPVGDANGMFWLQGLHMVNCAYNSLWIGQFMHPDWDMFQTTHASAEFHAGARAICGVPVYVSDCIGHHNFQILKRLVLPDGTTLRCCHFARPTRDRLFCNPLNEPNFYILKIWNLNKYSGVVGAFNCQGAGWDREQRRNRATTFDNPKHSFASTSPMDVEWSQSSHTMISVNGTEEFAVYSSQVKKLSVIRFADKLAVSLKPLECEIFTMAPLFKISDQVQWAPIGLLNMLNSGGSVQKVCRFKEETHETSRVQVWWERIKGKGYGVFAVYSSIKPKVCRLNGVAVDFDYNEEENKTAVKINWGGGAHCTVDIKLS